MRQLLTAVILIMVVAPCAAMEIPFGETATYTELAKTIGRKRAVRAVGSALHANPIAIIIPCHRVVPASGGIGKYAAGRVRKEWLLVHEQRSCSWSTSLR